MTFYRKSFLAFILAFAALTLGRGQAMAQWDWDWGDFPPGSIDGGSPFQYTCTQGQGTNTLTIGTGETPDSFVSTGNAICNFTGSVTGTKQCQYNLTWSGDLVACTQQNGDAVVTVSAKCADVIPFEISDETPSGSPSGTLTCPGVTDFLGIPDKTVCNNKFGSTNDILFFKVTLAGQTCNNVPNNPTGLKLGALTDLKSDYCHSAGELGEGGSPLFDCATKSASSDIHNVADVGECIASPSSWNVKNPCHDNGVGRVCIVNGAQNAFSFDVTELDPATAHLKGVPVNLKKGQPQCKITDCNHDGQLDLQCEFATCSGNNATAAPPLAAALGELTMSVNFLDTEGNTAGGLACTTTVKTTGK
jgi:hypothetical protein